MKDVLVPFFAFVRRQPRWVQIAVAIVLAAAVGLALGSDFKNLVPQKETRSASAQTGYTDGEQVQPPDSQRPAVSPAETDQATAQQRAAAWHNLNSARDDPKWTYIEGSARSDSFVRYKFYQESDLCLDVQRRKDGKPIEQWLWNPLPARPLHRSEDARG